MFLLFPTGKSFAAGKSGNRDFLESSSDRETPAASFSGNRKVRQLRRKPEFSVRIVIINKTERNVYDRHLDADLDADARAKVAETVECGIVDPQKRVRLRLAAEEKLLDARGNAHRAAEAIAAAENIDKLRRRQRRIVVQKKTAEARFELGRVSQSQNGRRACAEENIVAQKLAVYDLRPGTS